MAILGIDVGTSGCKICAFDSKGTVLTSSSRKYTELRGNGTREIVPDIVRTRVFEALEEITYKCPDSIQAICVTCLGESLVFLDENDQVLTNSMVTGDNRGSEGVDKICSELGADYTFRTTGLMPSQLYSLPKLIWLYEHTDVIPKTSKIFFYEDYIGYLLTGERSVSYSTAARSMAVDIHNLVWADKLLSMAGLTSDYFSSLVPSGAIIGYVKSDLADRLNMKNKHIPVIAGAHDQVCAALGCGFLDSALATDSIGTCECLALMLPQKYDEKVLKDLDMPCMIYPLPSSYFTTLEITTCGALTNWARDTLFSGTKTFCEKQGIDFFQYMDNRVSNLDTQVLILPQFGSSGHPDLNLSNMSGTICGLKLETTEEELYLALKESMIYQIKLAHEYATPLGLEFERLIMSGGAAHSKISAQLRADIYQRPVYSLANNEAGTLGCMILAAVAIGEYPDLVTCVKEVVHYGTETLPDQTRFSIHQEKYEKFKEFYNKMHDFK